MIPGTTGTYEETNSLKDLIPNSYYKYLSFPNMIDNFDGYGISMRCNLNHSMVLDLIARYPESGMVVDGNAMLAFFMAGDSGNFDNMTRRMWVGVVSSSSGTYLLLQQINIQRRTPLTFQELLTDNEQYGICGINPVETNQYTYFECYTAGDTQYHHSLPWNVILQYINFTPNAAIWKKGRTIIADRFSIGVRSSEFTDTKLLALKTKYPQQFTGSTTHMLLSVTMPASHTFVLTVTISGVGLPIVKLDGEVKNGSLINNNMYLYMLVPNAIITIGDGAYDVFNALFTILPLS